MKSIIIYTNKYLYNSTFHNNIDEANKTKHNIDRYVYNIHWHINLFDLLSLDFPGYLYPIDGVKKSSLYYFFYIHKFSEFLCKLHAPVSNYDSRKVPICVLIRKGLHSNPTWQLSYFFGSCIIIYIHIHCLLLNLNRLPRYTQYPISGGIIKRSIKDWFF